MTARGEGPDRRRLARLLKEAGSALDPDGVAALVAGILAAPPEIGNSWYALVADPTPPALAEALEELRAHLAEDYGGGYSTDTGPLGLMELTNVDFMNKLRQGAIRLRASPRQQLIRFEFLDPRFFHYGKRQYAPLALSAQYLRDSTITRFFRSTIDRGTFGIVQRLDAKGNPIDLLGVKSGKPEIDRFTFRIETQRVLSQRRHSIVFFNYNYEDVRLRNIDSLLIKDILQPDEIVRLSRFGTSFVYDTRVRCERRLPGSAVEETVSRSGEVCRYNFGLYKLSTFAAPPRNLT